MTYTADAIKECVANDQARLFASWSANRPPNWKPDERTVQVVCVGNWLSEELAKVVSDEHRRIQEAQYNRRSRSEIDLYALAAEIMTETIEGRVNTTRTPHRRWG